MSLNQNLKYIAFVSVISLFGTSCNQEIKKEVTPEQSENLTLAKKPDSWINDRVKNAEEKLKGTEAGTIVWNSIKAQGGLDKWFQNGPISYRFDYLPVSGRSAKISVQQIDTWSNKAFHQSVEDENDTYGWDGTNAWFKRNDTAEFDYDVRFWALTPYYFLGQPFIFDGQGVKLEKLADKMIDSVAYDIVKISFEAGTGDAPDDYYINYFDKETHFLKAIKYIVSYPKRFKKGEHSPEKLMVLTSYQEVDGITLAKSYETYSTDENGNKKELVTNASATKVKFVPELKNSYFGMPEGSTVVK